MPALGDLTEWMDEQTEPEIVWYAKRLSANDTLASGGHQAGPYLAKEFLFDMFPSLNRPDIKNPDRKFQLRIDSHNDAREVRAVWYNNKNFGGTRNEARVTQLGGASSALLDPDVTGALVVFAFHRTNGAEATVCHVWVCDYEVEEDLVEERIGPIEPGTWKIWSLDQAETNLFPVERAARAGCGLTRSQLPVEWLEKFPTGAEIIRKTVELQCGHGIPVDVRLMKRRMCEYEVFRSVEEALELPAIQRGFASVDDFVARALTVLQRRKSRSGRSLELHAREIFLEENLREGTDFQHQPKSEDGKNPDFLFPSQASYHNRRFPAKKLRMLGVKTTCKDRWSQILTEADRVKQKHLLTLQEGVSVKQFKQMIKARIQLVVPSPLIKAYPKVIRPHLQSLESFIGDVRLLNVD